MKLIKNFLYNAAYQIFLLLVPLLTTPYLSRTLGPEGVGINSFTNSVMQYFVIFGCLGTNIYANRKIAYVRNNKKELSIVFYEILLLRIIMLLVSFASFLVLIQYFNSHYFTYYLAQSVTILATMFDVSWFFMGIERFSVTVIRNFIVKICSLIAIFLLVKTYSDLVIYILIVSVSVLMGNLSMISSLKKYVYKIPIKKINIFRHFWPSLTFFVPEIATQVYLVLNKTMLGSMQSVQESGFYDQSDKIVKIVLAIVTATGTVMLPHVANAFANGNKEKTKEYLYDSFSIVTLISVPLCMGLSAVSYKLVPLFFSYKFVSVSPLLAIESLVIIFIAWSNAVGTQYLLPTKQAGKYTRSVVLGAVANILLNIPLIYYWSSLGAVLATVLSEFIITLYQFISVRNEVKFRLLFNGIHKYFIAGIVMYFIVFMTDRYFPSSWLYLFLEVLLGIVIYTIIIVFLKVDAFKIIKKMKNDY